MVTNKAEKVVEKYLEDCDAATWFVITENDKVIGKTWSNALAFRVVDNLKEVRTILLMKAKMKIFECRYLHSTNEWVISEVALDA